MEARIVLCTVVIVYDNTEVPGGRISARAEVICKAIHHQIFRSAIENGDMQHV